MIAEGKCQQKLMSSSFMPVYINVDTEGRNLY